MYAHIGIVSTAIIPANTAKGLSFAVFSVSFIAMTVLSDVLTSFGHVSLAATINSDGITDRPAIKMNSQCQLKWLMIKDPRDGAIIGPAIAADCNTVMIFLNFIPENESFIMAVSYTHLDVYKRQYFLSSLKNLSPLILSLAANTKLAFDGRTLNPNPFNSSTKCSLAVSYTHLRRWPSWQL